MSRKTPGEKLAETIDGLNKTENKIISFLLDSLLLLHFSVFPRDDRAPILNIAYQKPEEFEDEGNRKFAKKNIIAYDNENDVYVIFPHGAVKKIRSIREGSFINVWDAPVVIATKELYNRTPKTGFPERLNNLKLYNLNLPPSLPVPLFERDEVIVGCAAHEVRHRAQLRLRGICFFTLAEVEKLDNYELILLAMLIDSCILSGKRFEKRTKGKFFDVETIKRTELDAAIVGNLVVWAYKKGKEPEVLSQIIKLKNPADLPGLIAGK